MTLRWGVVATVKATLPEYLAFAAHHLDLGAHRVWLHLDDPADPAFDLLEGRKGLRAIRCDDAYWQRLCGGRPDTHQERQTRNATRLFRRAPVDFLLHVDVDEFLISDIDIPTALSNLPQGQDILRVEPFEALHDPGLPDDIFTARHFRGALRDEAALRALYGPQGPFLRHGMLSHSVGKAFFRCAAEGMVVQIHGARLRGQRVPGGAFHHGLSLLHFHAENPERWLSRLDYRLARGGYQFVPDLQAHLQTLDEGGRASFYHLVQEARPDLLAGLAERGILRRADLGLRAKIAAQGWGGLIPPLR
jgi:hypothetical protein